MPKQPLTVAEAVSTFLDLASESPRHLARADRTAADIREFFDETGAEQSWSAALAMLLYVPTELRRLMRARLIDADTFQIVQSALMHLCESIAVLA